MFIKNKMSGKAFSTKNYSMLLVSLMFLFTAIQEAFCSLNWESFEGCNVAKSCNYKTDQEMLIAYAKGLPNIKSKKYDEDFLICQEWFFLCGYVLKSSKNETSESSGIRIGVGVDLGLITLEDLSAMKINAAVNSKLRPYLGLRGKAAVSMLKANKNLTLSQSEAFDLSNKVHDYYLEDLAGLYNDLKKEENSTLNFFDLHLSIKTALFSLYYNRPKFDYKGMREALAANKWTEAADIIEALKGSRSRRKAEALLLRSLQVKCQNEMYISVLMDESGSINQSDFRKEIAFVSDLIKSNAENNKVFISLLTFSNSATVYSDFTNNRAALQNSLNSISKRSGGTNTGEAIFKGRSLFLATESYIKGNLDARIMIIITDGQSDNRPYTVSQAEVSRKSGIQIISVGVGDDLNLSELNDMSGGNKNVMLINDFSGLSAYLENLSASVCTQSSAIESNRTFSASLSNLDSPIYLQIEKSKSSNQKIIVNDSLLNDTITESKIIICASYNDPYPNQVSNELCHLGNNKGAKELVMESKQKALERDKALDVIDADFNFKSFKMSETKDNKKLRILENKNNANNISDNEILTFKDEEKEILYLSIKGVNVNFTIKAEECDPKDCQYGTNDIVSGSNSFVIVLFTIIGILFLLGVLFALFKFFEKRKNKLQQESISDVSAIDYGKLSS